MHDIDRAVQLARWEARLIHPHLLLESLAAHVALEFRVLSAVLGHSEPPSVTVLPASLATIPDDILEHILGEIPQGFDALRRPVLEAVATSVLAALEPLKPLLWPAISATLQVARNAFNARDYTIDLNNLVNLSIGPELCSNIISRDLLQI